MTRRSRLPGRLLAFVVGAKHDDGKVAVCSTHCASAYVGKKNHTSEVVIILNVGDRVANNG